MENKIKITKINMENNNKIIFDYQIFGECKKYFNLDKKFFVEYDINIQDVPNSVKIIPFLCNILPIAWISNAEIEIDSIDSEFYKSVEKLRHSYNDMYPNVNFNGGIIKFKKLENNNQSSNNNTATLFSGGVDSFSTLIAHIKENPELITIWGADIKLEDYSGWSNVKEHAKSIGESYNLKNNFIKSNLKTFINYNELNKCIFKETRG